MNYSLNEEEYKAYKKCQSDLSYYKQEVEKLVEDQRNFWNEGRDCEIKSLREDISYWKDLYDREKAKNQMIEGALLIFDSKEMFFRTLHSAYDFVYSSIYEKQMHDVFKKFSEEKGIVTKE